jgi:hypothetical protein
MSATTTRPPNSHGLEPRYWRERRKTPDMEIEETLPPLPVSVTLWSPDQLANPMDGVTPELRRRILETEPEPSPFPPAVALSIALALSAFLWLTLGNAVVVVGHLLNLI